MYKQMTRDDRIKMETLLNAGHSQAEVARLLGFHRSTISREFKRGCYQHLTTHLVLIEKYSSDLGQQKRDYLNEGKGKPLKIGNDMELANYLEDKIAHEKYSPAAALSSIKTSGRKFKTSICLRTLYRYIDGDVFYELTNKDLAIKGKRKKKHNHVSVRKRVSAGTCIDDRPAAVSQRDSFGHWEMDTVKGKKGTSKSCMLVLTERLTRKEIVVKLPDQGAASVVNALDRIENKYGAMFQNLFKSMTVDNGVEFSDFSGMERSSLHPGKRVDVYYCHPYSSWERGSNENNNKLIRRHIPKGVNFDSYPDSYFEYIEDWMNNYPRKLFNYKTANDMFREQLSLLV